jgi:hypothetical protein
MSDVKTKVTDKSVSEFINSIEDEKRRQECQTILDMMREATGEEPKIWGDSIVGFGSYHYKGKSGREGDWYVIGFAPRKQNLTLYIVPYPMNDEFEPLLEKLGKHKLGGGCLYLKKLADVDMSVLQEMITWSAQRGGNHSS